MKLHLIILLFLVLSHLTLFSFVHATEDRSDLPVDDQEVSQDEVSSDQEILFRAEQVVIDDVLGIVTATGDVLLVTQGRTLYADTISYHRNDDVITAFGNIELHDSQGTILYADEADMSTDMRNAFLANIRILFPDNSQFAGQQAELENALILRIHHLVYSPCFLCPDHPDWPPLWQLRAERAVYDRQKHDLRFRDVLLDFFGFPILYLPYISLPDPTVMRRSGLVTVNGGLHKDFGAFGRASVYFDLAPSLDATATVTAFTQTKPLLNLQIRKGFESGRITIDGAITRNKVADRNNVAQGERWRGQIQTQTRFDINDEWRMRGNFHRVSDFSFLRHHGEQDRSNFLESNGILEGFLDRDYITIQTSWFQSLRREQQIDEPLILPLVTYTAIGEPQRLLGGRWKVHADLRHIDHRDDPNKAKYAQTTRATFDPSWQRNLNTSIGMQLKVGGRLRHDLYLLHDFVSSESSDKTKPSWHFRFLPEAWSDIRYPFIRVGQAVDQVIEPRVALFLAPRQAQDRFPNEDSLDSIADSTSLFMNNRFTGTDRQEGGQRLTYGLSYSLYHNVRTLDGLDSLPHSTHNYAEFFVGQSFRLSTDQPFVADSGLDSRRSDLIGQMYINLSDWFKVFYGSQFNEDEIKLRRQNVQVSIDHSFLTAHGVYGFLAQRRDVRGRIQPQEEFLSLDIRTQVSRYWWVGLAHSHAFAPDPGPRETSIEIGYEDECLRFSVGVTQDRTSLPGVSDGLSVSFQVELKTLVSLIP